MENYNNEKEFIENYDVTKYDRLSMTTDIILVSVSKKEAINYRKTSKKMISILLVKRNDFPFKDKWCLPGGFLNPKNETLEECAKNVLKRESNLSDIYLEQLYTFDDIKRDPRTRVVSTAYVALVDKNKLTHELNESASWFDITEIKEIDNIVNITLDNSNETINFSIQKNVIQKTTDQYSFLVLKNESIAFDHPKVILSGIERIRNKINYTDIVFNMMPKYFTLSELQEVYEAILGEKLLAPAFRRIIANKVEKTDKMLTGKGHRPSVLYKYKEK
ncbi:MAG: NUDIX domain-containing protein [Clostridia bacterium]|jgi:8-oxo-dGTP diphosphatase|nr:NUDIX domain-containing protein [Clostridia bacterium]